MSLESMHRNFLFILSLLFAACGDDEISEQCILRAPVIILPDHRAVSNARCGHPQGGGREGFTSQMRTRGLGKKYFLEVLNGRPPTKRE